MFTAFRILLRGALRDRLSFFYAIIFPVVFLLVLGFIFPNSDYRYHLLAGMLSIGVLFFSLYGIAFEALLQRNRGVYKLLRATPYHILTFVSNLTAARSVMSLLSSTIVAFIGVLVFRLHFNWICALLLLPILLLGTLCFTFLGMTLSNFAQKETQVNILCNIVGMPMIFCSNAFYSLSGAPSWVKVLSNILPLTHMSDGIQAALVGNTEGLLVPMSILAGYTVLALVLATITFRWDPDSSALAQFI